MVASNVWVAVAGAVVAAAGAVAVSTAGRPAGPGAAPPAELGRVAWERDYPTALARARREGKPLMVLFDEVPGCATCKGFGSGALSHPLVVDAAGEFVPAAVFNNAAGADAAALKEFGEPAWNDPVMRFLGPTGIDLIPRKDGEYTAAFLLPRMAKALAAAGRPVPAYLELAAAECAPARRERAAFAVYCYWEAEAKLGALPGVLGTSIGSLDGSETVEVEFDPAMLPYEDLVGKAKEMDCTHRVFARTDGQFAAARALVGGKAARSDVPLDARTVQQYHLAHRPEYHHLPLTALQATRANAALASGTSPDGLLSPGQLALLARARDALRRNPRALADLRPDRSPTGLGKYAAELEGRLAG